MQMLCRAADGRVMVGQIFQQHGQAHQGGAGVGQVLAGNVRGAAVNGFED